MGEIAAIDEVIYMFKNGVGGAPKNSILVNMYSDMRLKLTGEPFEEYKDEKINGYQELHFESGSVYKGYVVNNEFHGKGKYIFSDGLVYEGDFFFGKPKGYGKITYPSGVICANNLGRIFKAKGLLNRSCNKVINSNYTM